MKIIATTLGDFLTKPVSKGGLDMATLAASLVSIALMTLLIIFSHFSLSKVSATKVVLRKA